MVVQSSLSKKPLPENGGFISEGFPSKFKRRPKPCAVRSFPRGCGPLNTGIHSPVKCSSIPESSPCSLASGTNGGRTEGFNNMEEPKILDDIPGEIAGENVQKLGSLAAVWENALEKVAETIALAQEFVAILDGECSTSKNSTDVAVLEAAKAAEEGLVARISEGGADINLRRVQGKNNTGLELKCDYLGDESYMETEGGEILSKSVDGQNLDEKVSGKGGEGGADVNLKRVQEKDITGQEVERGDDIYVSSPQEVKLWQPCFEERFLAKALMPEHHAKFGGDGRDVVGSQGTEIVVLEDGNSNGESVSEKNRKNCGENWHVNEITDSLQTMSGQQSCQSKHEAIKRIMNAKMKKGQSIGAHVLNMFNYFTEAKTHGAIIDEGTQVSMILESLSLTFLQFKKNYIMNKLNYNMTQLINELQIFETIFIGNVQEGGAKFVEDKTYSSKASLKRKAKGKGDRAKEKQKKCKSSKEKKKADSAKPKGKCFYCGVDGHWKRNCNNYLTDLKEKRKAT